MYTLYYFNRNQQLGNLKVKNFDSPVLIPEDLVFTNLRKGINFIKEPHECIAFTDLERLFITSEFFDASLVKDAEFRRQNTYLETFCAVETKSFFNEETLVMSHGEHFGHIEFDYLKDEPIDIYTSNSDASCFIFSGQMIFDVAFNKMIINVPFETEMIYFVLNSTGASSRIFNCPKPWPYI